MGFNLTNKMTPFDSGGIGLFLWVVLLLKVFETGRFCRVFSAATANAGGITVGSDDGPVINVFISAAAAAVSDGDSNVFICFAAAVFGGTEPVK
jgi:hypothetical protein